METKKRPQPHDNWAKFYDHIYDQTFGSVYSALTEKTLLDISNILPTGSITDYGAGTGRMAIPLKQQGYKVTAVEKSAGMATVIAAKSEKLRIEFPIHNCSISNYRGTKADLALCLFTVLNYSTTEEELYSIFLNIVDHLNPGGYFFFDLPNSVFFTQTQLVNRQTSEFSRTVTINPSEEENIYIYSESCIGSLEGEKFSINDSFPIRYWRISTIDRYLKEIGLIRIEKSFTHYNSTGSTYNLYQKL